MIYQNKFSYQEQYKLEKIKTEFKWNDDQLDYLIACIGFESNFNPQARNRLSGAVGLIQFMPKTAESLGTTTDLLFKMNTFQQLSFVKDYFNPYYKKVKTLEDMYMAILMPSMIGKANSTNIFTKAIQYKQNIGLDLNKDGVITKSEACNKVIKIYEKGKLYS